jgi:hypothetical protein
MKRRRDDGEDEAEVEVKQKRGGRMGLKVSNGRGESPMPKRMQPKPYLLMGR